MKKDQRIVRRIVCTSIVFFISLSVSCASKQTKVTTKSGVTFSRTQLTTLLSTLRTLRGDEKVTLEAGEITCVAKKCKSPLSTKTRTYLDGEPVGPQKTLLSVTLDEESIEGLLSIIENATHTRKLLTYDSQETKLKCNDKACHIRFEITSGANETRDISINPTIRNALRAGL